MKICKKDIFVLIFFLLLTFLFTYPLVCKPFSSIYGITGFCSDPFSLIWEIWLYKYAKISGESIYPVVSLISYPFGWDRAGDPRLPVLEYSIKILSGFFDEIFIYNLLILVGIFGTAAAMYFFVLYIVKNRCAAFLSAFVFSFSGDHLMHSMQHLGFGLLFWVPLYFYALIRLFEQPCCKNSILCALFFALLLFTNYYYAYFIVVATALFVFVKLIVKKLNAKEIKYLFLTVAFTAVITSYFVYPVFCKMNSAKDEKSGTFYQQPYQDLVKYSARWQDYLLPSEFNPFLGWITKKYVEREWGGRHYFEKTLYIGLLPLLFSAFGVFRYKIIKEKNGEVRVPILYFLCLAAVGFLFSMPPVIVLGGIKIPMPSFFLHKILPMFRVYSRFGIMVIFSVAVLFAVALKYIFDTLRDKARQGFAFSAIFVFVLIEVINVPPFHNVDLSKIPSAYQWMSGQASDIVIAEYPWERRVSGVNSDYLFYQRVHNKRMINVAPEGSFMDAVRKECEYLQRYETAQLLSFFGVDQVIVHKNMYSEGDLKQIDNNKGLAVLKDFTNEKVYKITAEPLILPIVCWNNIGNWEKWDDGNYWRWMGNNAVIWIGNKSKSEKVSIEFKILSYAKTRKLIIYCNNRPIYNGELTASSGLEDVKTIKLENIYLIQGGNILKFYSPHGEVKIADIVGNDDERMVSFAMSDFNITGF